MADPASKPRTSDPFLAAPVKPDWPLTTERLTLRPWAEGDFGAFYEMQRDEEVARWNYNDPRDEAEARRVFDYSLMSYEMGGNFDWINCAVVAGDEVVGALRSTFAAVSIAAANSDSLFTRAIRARATQQKLRVSCCAGRSRGRLPPRLRTSRAAQHGVMPGDGEARYAQGGSPRRERVGQGRVAERRSLRDVGTRVGLQAEISERGRESVGFMWLQRRPPAVDVELDH